MVSKQVGFLFVAVILLGGILQLAMGHGNHHRKQENSAKNASIEWNTRVAQVNQAYLKSVKPIFVKKCFDCHSNQTSYPWYHQIPGIRNRIEQDIVEGRKHIDFSKDFPFQGHGSPIDDLKALKKITEDDSMPPFGYKLMHPFKSLSSVDKEAIQNWINDSERTLNRGIAR